MTWREEAAAIIVQATRGLPNDLPLKDRMKIVDAACPSYWRGMSWPQKAWQAARRDYLIQFGYYPRTKEARQNAEAYGSPMPLFPHSMEAGE